MRIPFIAANWKMFKTVHEAVVVRQGIPQHGEGRRRRRDRRRAAVHRAARRRRGGARTRTIGVAGQNLHWEREGAFTGEISAGDAEGGRAPSTSSSATRSGGGCSARPTRRSTASSSRRSAAQLTPIVCIGETLEERETDETLAVLDRQIKDGPRRPHGGPGRRAGHRLRAGVGDRHRPQRHAAAGRRGARAHPVAAAAVVRRRRPPTTATSSTAAA